MPTSFDPVVIQMIRCPVTGSVLTAASDALIASVNLHVDGRNVVDQIGQTVDEKLDGGFVNEDQSLLHPVRGGIVILVAEQAIPLACLALQESPGANNE